MANDSMADEGFAPGDRFGGYVIAHRIGAGDFGAVYDATREADGRRVALKVLHCEVQGNEQIVKRFTREAKAVGLLEHPNIVAAVEVGEADGRPFLAMERLEGETLGALMRRERRLDVSRALDIAIPLMAAVRTVHAHGIVHRDLKPDNVFITTGADGALHPKILDFGFAKMAGAGLHLTGKDTAIGTPNFMSPEQMLTPLGVDPKSDQWALGVMMYFMLTGVKPFEGKTLADTLKAVLHREPTPLAELAPQVPAGVCEAVMRALRKPLAERWASVHDFAQALVAFASDETALLYAREFYTVEVWEQLGESPPVEEEVQRSPRRQRRARASSPLRTSAPSHPPTLAAPRAPPPPPSSATASRPGTLPPPVARPREAVRSTPPVARPPAPPAQSVERDAMPEMAAVAPTTSTLTLVLMAAGVGAAVVLGALALRALL